MAPELQFLMVDTPPLPPEVPAAVEDSSVAMPVVIAGRSNDTTVHAKAGGGGAHEILLLL